MPALFTSPASGSSPSASRAAAIWAASVTSSVTVRRPRARSRSASSSLRTRRDGVEAELAQVAARWPRRCPVEAPVTSTVPVAMAANLSASFAGVDVEDAIRTRRTHKAYGAEPVPRETLEELFELARWAPNHNLTNPWRFRVLGPESLARAEGGRRRRRPPRSSTARRRSWWRRSRSRGDPVQDEEDLAAAAVAAYIVLLARARPRARRATGARRRCCARRRAARRSACPTASGCSACSTWARRGRRRSRPSACRPATS